MSKLPIKHWSHSSLVTFLRNPLAWYKRYVEEIYDTPSGPASIIGKAGHLALENFYRGEDKEKSIQLGLLYLKNTPDFEINFGKAESNREKKKKRLQMEKEYLQAINFYLSKPPKHKVLGVEVKALAHVEGLKLPIKAVSDLVVESRTKKGAVDIVDHKFVDSFSSLKGAKSLFVLQAIFNYYTVLETFKRPVENFLVYECKKKKNADGSAQLRKYSLKFSEAKDDFRIFHQLLRDATEEISRPRLYLPNPTDMFEGENSFDIYRMGLIEEDL